MNSISTQRARGNTTYLMVKLMPAYKVNSGCVSCAGGITELMHDTADIMLFHIHS